jgi:hypothetical protein
MSNVSSYLVFSSLPAGQLQPSAVIDCSTFGTASGGIAGGTRFPAHIPYIEVHLTWMVLLVDIGSSIGTNACPSLERRTAFDETCPISGGL